jgi:molybdenum cofactor cytidylyltransferase
MSSVTAVVLAAGASERMGEPKLLLPYLDATVLDATIAAVEASAVDRVIVVTGARAEAVEASLEMRISSSSLGGGAAVGGGRGHGGRQSPVASRRPGGPSPSIAGSAIEQNSRGSETSISVVRNPDYRRGNMSSLLTATTGDRKADAFIVVPGDLPTIRTDVIDSVIELWVNEAPWAAVTTYRDRIAHPILLSSTAVESMEEMTGEKVLGRILIETDDDRVARLSVPFEAPQDVNTPEDYEALLAES